jgi:hypothetical protein
MRQIIEDKQANEYHGDGHVRPEPRQVRLKNEKKWMLRGVSAAHWGKNLRQLNEELFQLYPELDRRQQHESGRKCNATNQDNSRLSADDTSPKLANIPSFMTEYYPAPGPGPSNPNDEPAIRRSIIGRPIWMVPQARSVIYHQWKFDKHRSKDFFKRIMKFDIELPE